MIKDQYVPIIQEIANHTREKYALSLDDVIGNYIFTILQEECLVLMRPNEKQPDLDGFSTEKIVKGKKKTLVYINTAKNVEKQNFCAAHELGHRYAVDRMIRDKFPYDVILPDHEEKIMNRFAAELMMPEKDFRRRSLAVWWSHTEERGEGVYQISEKNAIGAIIWLMDFYYMPYKAVLYRLKEVHVISTEICKRLEKYEDQHKAVVDKMIADMGITRLRTPDNKLQNSVAVKVDAKIFDNVQITKYISEEQLTRYMENLGLSKENIDLAKQIRKIETAMLDVPNISERERRI